MSYISIIVFAGVISGIGLFAYHIYQTSKEIDKMIKTRREVFIVIVERYCSECKTLSLETDNYYMKANWCNKYNKVCDNCESDKTEKKEIYIKHG